MKTVMLSLGRRAKFNRRAILYGFRPNEKRSGDDRRGGTDRRNYTFQKEKYMGKERRAWLTDTQ